MAGLYGDPLQSIDHLNVKVDAMQAAGGGDQALDNAVKYSAD